MSKWENVKGQTRQSCAGLSGGGFHSLRSTRSGATEGFKKVSAMMGLMCKKKAGCILENGLERGK